MLVLTKSNKEAAVTVTFRSEKHASVEMIEANAKELLDVLGKRADDPRGVFTIDQVIAAISVLQALIAERADCRKVLARADTDGKAGEVFEVDISLRAIPLLELFEAALVAKKPVTWGI